MYKILALLIVCLTAAAAFAGPAPDASRIFGHAGGIWEIPGTDKETRWLIIHNLAEARETGRPAWNVRRICDHMAITLPALERSVVRPLESGAVYPESFESAFAKWKKQAEGGDVCATSVKDCLKGK